MRRIEILIYPEFQLLDATGPAQVFATASALADDAYEVILVARHRQPVPSTSGVEIVANESMSNCKGPLDTLMIAGGEGTQQAARDRQILTWTRRRATNARRLTSVCSGSFVLAAAGLLEGRRATTHWSRRDELARRFPKVQVDPEDPVFVRDGDIWTSAGVTAGMDLALSLVEDDLGHDIALQVARELVLYLKRSGGQRRFSEPLRQQVASRKPIKDAQHFIAEHPAEDLSVPALASQACMSERNFSRVFRDEVGTTPAAYVEAARVEFARCLLSSSDQTVGAVAREAGFASTETLHRAFRRVLATTPANYRQRFNTTVRN